MPRWFAKIKCDRAGGFSTPFYATRWRPLDVDHSIENIGSAEEVGLLSG